MVNNEYEKCFNCFGFAPTLLIKKLMVATLHKFCVIMDVPFLPLYRSVEHYKDMNDAPINTN